jgi:hypothetical protein
MSIRSASGWRGVAIALGLTLAAVLLPARPSHAAIPDGRYQHYINDHSRLCITTDTVPNHQLTQWPCDFFGQKLWSKSFNTVTHKGYTYHQIINQLTGWCIGVLNGSTAGLAQVVSKGCNDAATDQWWAIIVVGFTSNTNLPIFIMANLLSGKCIKIKNASTAFGAGLVQDPCDRVSRLWTNGFT